AAPDAKHVVRRTSPAALQRRKSLFAGQLFDADLLFESLLGKWQGGKLPALNVRQGNDIVVKSGNLHPAAIVDHQRQQPAQRVDRIGHRPPKSAAMEILLRSFG